MRFLWSLYNLDSHRRRGTHAACGHALLSPIQSCHEPLDRTRHSQQQDNANTKHHALPCSDPRKGYTVLGERGSRFVYFLSTPNTVANICQIPSSCHFLPCMILYRKLSFFVPTRPPRFHPQNHHPSARRSVTIKLHSNHLNQQRCKPSLRSQSRRVRSGFRGTLSVRLQPSHPTWPHVTIARLHHPYFPICCDF
jgi:hypothetical protein